MIRFAVLALLIASPCVAQHVTVDTPSRELIVTAEDYTQISGVSNVAVFTEAGVVLVEKEETEKLKPIPAVVLRVVAHQTSAAKLLVKATNAQREPVYIKELIRSPDSDNVVISYLLNTPGRQWVDIIDLINVDWQTIVVDIGKPDPDDPDVPDPDDPDDPDVPDPPDPAGPFDGLAARVAAVSSRISSSKRKTIGEICETVAAKMKSFEWRQSSQATEYVGRNFPIDSTTQPLWDLLAEDGRSRLLSWQEFQAYYLEVAKGVK